MRKELLILAAVIPALLFSCSGGRTGSGRGIIPEKEMAGLLLETHLADAILITDLSPVDIKRDRALYFYPSILEKFGVTKAQADSSIAFYVRHPEAYARIYEQVIKDLEKRQTADKKVEPTE